MFENPHIEETPQCSPGCCYACGAGSLARKWFLNTDLDSHDTPGYTIYFCDSCFDVLAVIAGYAKIIGPVEPSEKEVDESERIRSALAWVGLDADRLLASYDRTHADPETNSNSEPSDAAAVPTGENGVSPVLESGENGSSEQVTDEDVGSVRSSKSKRLRVLPDATVPEL